MSVPVSSLHVRGGFVARAWAGRWAVVVGVLVVATAMARPPVAPVDEHTELQVGEITVSRYLVEKNLARFRAEFARRARHEPEPADLARWLERFATQQGLIAQALRDGYGTRPEVTAIVERMERHMLTHLDGLLYAWLLDDSDDPDAASARALPITPEAAAAEAMPGAPSLTPAPAQVRRAQLHALRQRRLARTLREVRATVNGAAATELWTQLSRAELRGGVIPDSALGECAALPLVRFDDTNDPGAVPHRTSLPSTAADWQRYFNRLLLRKLPRDAEELHESVEAMVLEECDARAARVAGVDATAKFRADRENFRRAQALELFLREHGTAAGGPNEALELARGWEALREFDAVSAAQDFLVRWRPRVGAGMKSEPLSPHSAELKNPTTIP